MAGEVGTAWVDIRPDLKGFGPRLTTGVMASVPAAGRRIGAGLAAGMGATIAKGGAIAATAVGLTAVANAAQNVIGVGIRYDKTMSVFQSVTRATTDQMAKAQAMAQLLGNDLNLPGVSAAGAAEAMTELAKAGLTTQQSIDAARGALALSIAGQTGEATAATITANALLMFGLQAKEATRITDLLAGAANASSASMTDIAFALQMGGTAAKGAKVPIEDTITTLTMLANAGIRGSDAGTLMKTALQRMTAPTKKAKGLMDKLGLAFYDSKGHFVGMRSAVDQLQKKLGPLGEQQRNEAINTLFGADAMRLAQIAITQGAKKYDSYNKQVTRSGQAAQLAKAQQAGLGGALDNLQSTLEGVGLQLYKKIQPALTKGAKGLTAFIQKTPGYAATAKTALQSVYDLVVKGDFTSAFRKTFGVQEDSGLVDKILTVRDAIADLVQTFKASDLKNAFNFGTEWESHTPFEKIASVAGEVFKNIKAAIPPVVTAFKNLWGFLEPVRNGIATMAPVVARFVLTAIVLGSKALPVVAKGLAAVTGFLNKHKTIIYAVVTGVLAFVGVLKTQMLIMKGISLGVKAFQLLKGAILGVRVAMVLLKYAFMSNPIGIIIGIVMALVAAFIYLWKNNAAFRKFWIGLWDKIKGAAKAVGDWFTGTLMPALSGAWDAVTGAWDSVVGWFTGLWDSITSGAQSAWDWITTTLTGIGDAIGRFVGFIAGWAVKIFMWLTWPYRMGIAIILAVIGWLIKLVWPHIQAFINLAVSGFRTMWTWITNIFNGIRNFIVGVWNAVVAFITPIINAIVTFVVTRFNILRMNVMRVFYGVRSVVMTVWNAVWGFISRIVARIATWVMARWTTLRNNITALWNTVSGFISGVWNTIWTNITTFVGNIWNTVSEGFHNLVTAITDQIGNAQSAAGDLVGGIWDTITNWVSGLWELGSNIVQGLINGIVGNGRRLYDAVMRFVKDNVPEPILKALGIASPSKVTHRLGKFAGQGLINGLLSTEGQLNKAVTGMAGTISDGFSSVDTPNGLFNAKTVAAQRLRAANLAAAASASALGATESVSTTTTDARITINGDIKAADVGDFENQMYQRRRLAALAGRRP